MSRILSTSLLVILAYSFTGLSARADEPIEYRVQCKATSAGLITTSASASTPQGSKSDRDGDNLNQLFSIIDPDELGFSGFGKSKSKAKLKEKERCNSKLKGTMKGETGYSFKGNKRVMQFIAETESKHNARLKRRGDVPGGPATVQTFYEIPQVDALDVNIPFNLLSDTEVIGHLNLARTDSGKSSGDMVGVWQLWQDVNCNCIIDVGDIAVEGDKGIVGPNSQFDNTKSVRVSAGCYVMQYTYFNRSSLVTLNPTCETTVQAKSDTQDFCEIFHEMR